MKKMKRYETGGDIDALEAANKSEESQSIADEAKGEAMLKGMRDQAPKPKPRAKPAMPALNMDSFKAAPSKSKTPTPDTTQMPVNERIKKSIEDNVSSARSGSGKTDSRSVNERIRSGFRSTFGFSQGGSVSASSRADGIAQRGKTRGKMC